MLCKQYYNFRNELKDGDILVYHGTKILGCNHLEQDYYSHVGIVKWVNKRVFTFEIWNGEVLLYPLSKRMKNYSNFYIVRAKNKSEEEISNSLNFLFENVNNKSLITLSKKLFLLIYRLTGISMFGIDNYIKNISSQFVKKFTNHLSVNCYDLVNNIMPKNFILNADEKEMETIFELK